MFLQLLQYIFLLISSSNSYSECSKFFLFKILWIILINFLKLNFVFKLIFDSKDFEVCDFLNIFAFWLKILFISFIINTFSLKIPCFFIICIFNSSSKIFNSSSKSIKYSSKQSHVLFFEFFGINSFCFFKKDLICVFKFWYSEL